MISFIGRSITRKILASFIGIYFITYCLTAAVVFTGVRNTIIGSETQFLSQLAEVKAERLVSALNENSVHLRAWSSLDIMNDIISGDVDKRVHSMLEGLKSQYELSGNIYALDQNGKLIASSDTTDMSGTAIAPQNWFPNDGNPFFVNKHKGPFDDAMIVAQIQPITAHFSENYRIGFLVLTLPWDTVEKLTMGDGVKTVLVNTSTATEILATDMPESQNETLHALIGTQQTALLDSTSYVVGRAALAKIVPDMVVIALRKTDVAVRSVRKVAFELAALGLVLSFPIIWGGALAFVKTDRPRCQFDRIR